MPEILETLDSAIDLHGKSAKELKQVADEIREVLCGLLSIRTAHFASNLGVVELCLALHSTFDFRHDRLIWDTGHQVYPHKLVTGRYKDFANIRTRGGLMGYPNPAESEYDLFMTGHAGCSISTALGLQSGDDIRGEGNRKSVAVIGDGAFPSGIVFEALNNAGELKSDLLMILNDNRMSICPRVGSVATYLDRLRTNPFYTGLKTEVVRMLNHVPVFGDPAERMLAQIKEGVKAGLHGGMLFEELGIRYVGPIDGHDIELMRKYLRMVKDQEGPVLLHVVTEKGHGYQPAAQDPVFFHTPPAFRDEQGEAKILVKSGSPAYTNFARDAIGAAMRRDPRVTVMTAAMCQGNKLEPVREEFPKRFFDVGICESHAVAFAGGQAKTGLKPIVTIYSTFLQRSYDQIFQEAALQNLPVTFMMDRAGLAGPDGPTHHGVYDIGYMRVFPNMVLMAPGTGAELGQMLDFAIELDCPVGIRYPKAAAAEMELPEQPIKLGKSQVARWGTDGAILGLGPMLELALAAAEQLAQEGIDIAVINPRFIKPLDQELLAKVFNECRFVITAEEGALMGGFGSAVLELACDQGWDTRVLKRLGIPDEFVEHGEREDLLADAGMSVAGLVEACRELASRAALSV
ncbi:1-deoxy-D-xylulose-5-phosphate synthase [Aureliella helgolandensis]|uniref:1-deoxy-D-xylulose-5-phosphate synthase n=1 Tax=Aureliella helgolandensis TaxID=2527968 RepID=A0A518GF13_9BACT|nr:1-deoxy-D-xylulose-5-phosphate synthase [Aureliella helgolandensis]QDV27191.1 1-deoxy-D-xylulose-5-phosphate synthase [Aureliella helgolandensis]